MPNNDNLSRRRFLKATGGAATAAAVAGCIDTGSNSGGSGNTLNRINGPFRTLDPIVSESTTSGRVIQQMFEALMTYPNGEATVEKSLAKDYQLSNDGKTFTFTLKQGVKFHNGDELTADDVIYSWERLAASDNSLRATFILDDLGVKHETKTVEQEKENGKTEQVEVYKPETMAVEKTGDYQIKMTLAEPFHATLEMLAYTAFAVVPEGIVGDIKGYDGEMKQTKFAQDSPIGSGPFKFEKWTSGTEVEVSKFENYHGEVASIDGVHWQIMTDPTSIYNRAMNKNVDAFEMPTAQYDASKVSIEETDDLGREIGTYGPVRNGDTMNYLRVPSINTFYIGFNTNAVEKPVRKAIAHILNQETMVKEAFKGRGQGAFHLTPPSIYPGGATAYTEHAKNEYPYGYNKRQTEEAKKVMENAGYGPNNMYDVEFTVYKSSSAFQKVGSLLVDQLKSAHINMTLKKTPLATMQTQGENGNLEAYSLGWIMDYPKPDNFLKLLNPPQTDTSKSAPISYLNWSDTEASQRARDAWKKISRNTKPTDAAKQKRNEAYVAMEEANWEDVAFLNIFHEAQDLHSYQNVDMPKFGGAGLSRLKYNTTTLK